MTTSIRSVPGTRDLLPAEIPHWHHLEETARRLCRVSGYREIRTPMFEEVELFTRGMGLTAGLIERELWTFHDKHGRKLALRADLTAPVVRAWREHELGKAGEGLQKVYYLGPVFRYGKEEGQESRQVHQFGVEALGSEDPALDAEVIFLAWEYCRSLGLQGARVEMNSLGSGKSRQDYEKLLRDFFAGRSKELCPTCRRRYRSHPLWTLGCAHPRCQELARVVPTIFGTLSPEEKARFQTVQKLLEALEVPLQINPRVVRDLEYYNDTLFRVTWEGRMLASGGRYDGLVEKYSGPPTPAVGFACELEEVLEALRESGASLPETPPVQVLLAADGEEGRRLLVPALYRLRRAGVYADLAYSRPSGVEVSRIAQGAGALVVLRLPEGASSRHARVSLEERATGSSETLALEEALARVGRILGVELGQDRPRSGRRRKGSSGRARARKKAEEHGPSEEAASGGEDNAATPRKRRRRRRKPRGNKEARE